MNKSLERLYNGIIKENPTLVLMLGMCPTLAVTTSAFNGLGMGLTTLVVLTLSNMIISMLRKVIPNKIRIPAFIVIIASFVTIMQLILQAYMPDLYKALGIYIPLIVVNCIILGRAEAYAYKNPVLPSIFDGLGMGIGFTIALTLIGLLREFLGACSVFGYELGWFAPVGIFRMAPGAFFVLALLTAIQNKVKIAGEKRGRDMSRIQSGCAKDCMSCNMICGERREPFKDETVEEPEVIETVEEPEVNETAEEPEVIEIPEEPEIVETAEDPEIVETAEEPESIEINENSEAIENSGNGEASETIDEVAEEPVANEVTAEPPIGETPIGEPTVKEAGDEEPEFEDPDFESDGKIVISDDDDFLDMEGLEKMMEDDVDLDEKETKPAEPKKSKKKDRKKKRKDRKHSDSNNTNSEEKEEEL